MNNLHIVAPKSFNIFTIVAIACLTLLATNLFNSGSYTTPSDGATIQNASITVSHSVRRDVSKEFTTPPPEQKRLVNYAADASNTGMEKPCRKEQLRLNKHLRARDLLQGLLPVLTVSA